VRRRIRRVGHHRPETGDDQAEGDRATLAGRHRRPRRKAADDGRRRPRDELAIRPEVELRDVGARLCVP